MKSTMRGSATLAGLFMAGVFLVSQPVFAQFAGGGGGGFGGQGGGGGFGGQGGLGGLTGTQLQDAALQRYKTQISFTDEEWTIIGPKMWRVLQLEALTGTGLFANGAQGAGGGGGGRGGGRVTQLLAQALNTDAQSRDLQQKKTAMETAIADPKATEQAIGLKLEDYRIALKKARDELAVVQKDLRSVCTVRQEAWLVQLGFLD